MCRLLMHSFLVCLLLDKKRITSTYILRGDLLEKYIFNRQMFSVMLLFSCIQPIMYVLSGYSIFLFFLIETIYIIIVAILFYEHKFKGRILITEQFQGDKEKIKKSMLEALGLRWLMLFAPLISSHLGEKNMSDDINGIIYILEIMMSLFIGLLFKKSEKVNLKKEITRHLGEKEKNNIKEWMYHSERLDVYEGLNCCVNNEEIYIRKIWDFYLHNYHSSLEENFITGTLTEKWNNYQSELRKLNEISWFIGAVDFAETVEKIEKNCTKWEFDELRMQHNKMLMEYDELWEEMKVNIER